MTVDVTRTPRVVDDLRSRHSGLVADGPEPGRAWCRAWSDAVDDALRSLAEEVAVPGRWCLAAVGGYGRRELCPGSDVDLLVVHDGLDEPDLEHVVRAIVYPLWDAQLTVGYAVRSRKEAVAAVDELADATTLLDVRPVHGDTALLRGVQDRALARLRRRPGRFLDALTAADDERRARSGHAAEVLEPDLKSGAGGLRDVQSLRWGAAVLLGSVGLDPLVSAGYLGAEDRSRLSRAYDRLLAERVATHLTAGRKEDTVAFPLQEEVARRLGHVDGADDRDTAAHRLLSEHFLAARTIDHVHARAWRLISADATAGRRRRRPAQAHVDGFEIVDGVLRLGDVPVGEPDLPVRLLRALVRSGAVLDRRTAATLRRASEVDPPWTWTDTARRHLLGVLWRGEPALSAMAELDDAGVLVAMLPEWEPVRGRAQRNPFHRYSLDRHAWHAAAELGELVRREPWAADTLERVVDRDALMLGTLLHDVGKAAGEPHSETGVPVARAVCERLGASPATTDRVGRMVRLHLLLPDVALRRDLADPVLVDAVAEEVGSPEMLAALHLLAAADGRATGPSAWTAWKASLVQTLVVKVAHVLDDTTTPDELSDGAVATTREAQQLASELGTTAEAVRDHLARLPQRYAAHVSPRAVVRHCLMTASPPEPTEVRTRVTPGADREDDLDAYDELDVVAVDAPGLFSRVAGVLALNGGSVMGAAAFTRDDGVAVDTFTVVRPEGAPASWWARVEGDLVDAVAGRLALRARVARRARQEERRLARLPEVDTAVTVTEDESGSASLVEVHTVDRVGALFTITEALAELTLDIVVARVQTLGHEVVDVFTVRDGAGRPLDDDHAAEVQLAVTSALEALGTAGG